MTEKIMIDTITPIVHKYLDIARKQYPTVEIKTPRIVVSNRMTTTAGLASRRGGCYTVKFSAPIIRDNGIERFSAQTVPHEVAHIVQWCVFGCADHSSTFYYIMRNVFNISKDRSARCHTYKTRKRGGQVAYKCSVCGHQMNFGATRHKRATSGLVYRHRCGGKMELVEA
jgi:predicted SprT family Zn-dependent metalloprotease